MNTGAYWWAQARATDAHPRPAPKTRAPLTAFNMSGSPATTLPANQRTLPGPYDPLFWRGNAWSVTVPGLPFLPALTSSKNPERCLTWFLGHSLWKKWIDKILTAHAERGYTHFTLGFSDALAFCNQTAAEFVDLCAYVRSWGFDVHVQLGSKYVDDQDATWNGYWRDRLTPVLQALTARGSVQHVSIWEANSFNVPGPKFQDILNGIAALSRPSGVRQWVHFLPGVTWWGDGRTPGYRDRFEWWETQKGILTGLLYQIDCFGWDNGMRQARIQDTTTRDQNFIDGTFKFVAWETDGAVQFDGDQPDEDHSDADGYLLLCTPGGCPVSGVGGGFRLPDGRSTFDGTFR